MDNDGKVYIVTAGEYSDYHIRKVFSSRARAQQYVDATDANKIEAWEVDDSTPREDWGAWRVVIDAKDGSVLGCLFFEELSPNEPAKFLEDWGEHGGFYGTGITKEHARRSAEEYRREHKAFGEAP